MKLLKPLLPSFQKVAIEAVNKALQDNAAAFQHVDFSEAKKKFQTVAIDPIKTKTGTELESLDWSAWRKMNGVTLNLVKVLGETQIDGEDGGSETLRARAKILKGPFKRKLERLILAVGTEDHLDSCDGAGIMLLAALGVGVWKGTEEEKRKWIEENCNVFDFKEDVECDLTPSTRMPRGYLKRQIKAVGRKSARGGNSRSHQTPACIKEWKRYERHVHERYEKDYIDEAMHSGCEATFWEDTYFESLSVQSSAKDGPGNPAVLTSREAQEDSSFDVDHSLTRFTKTYVLDQDNHETCSEQSGGGDDATDSFFVLDETTLFNLNREQSLRTGSIGPTDHSSYSFCDTAEPSTGFSLVPNEYETIHNDESSASTIWEFVADSIGNKEAPFGRIVLCESEIKDVESISCITDSPHPSIALVHHETRLQVSMQCAICLEDKPNVLRVMHKCTHPSACVDCLRKYYIDHELDGAAANFPFQCFWPGCTRTLRDVHFRQLARSQQEMQSYYQRVCIARNNRRQVKLQEVERLRRERYQKHRIKNFKVFQQCNVCGTSRPVYPARQDYFTCATCDEQCFVDVMSLEEIMSIVAAVGDFLVYCPTCERLIAKDGGCDHMTCLCGNEFSFRRAQIEFQHA
eukprot:scaffold456_cov171-Amphora_coffeaeformis.AAC.4